MLINQSKIFHPGETELQTLVGSREWAEKISTKFSNDFLIEQHRQFFAGLEYVFLSTLDASGSMSAVMISGEQGFLSTPNERTLRLNTATSDALFQLGDLQAGTMIGVLGIDMSNRRRNRMHGKISATLGSHVDIHVTQSFGNCPKYINVRMLTTRFRSTDRSESQTRLELDEVDRSLIRASDTFFISSYFNDGLNKQFDGADISHRGGSPGFIRVQGSSITFPDYAGNNLFTTLGNLLVNPVTALLFVDFETGDTLKLNGTAEIVTDQSEVQHFPKALRLVRVAVTRVTTTKNSTALRWSS